MTGSGPKPVGGGAHAAAGPRLRPATAGDGSAVLRLLEEAGLPTEGVREWLPRFVVAEEGAALVGVGGLEVYGTDAVLRSVAVAPARRGRGLGAALTDRLLEEARAAGIRRVYLLTTTAEAYFPRHGFRAIPREEAAQGVRASVEFQGACPASAALMVLELDALDAEG